VTAHLMDLLTGREEVTKRPRKPIEDNEEDDESNQLKRAVLTVGEGRGFVVTLNLEERLVITAAHCLEHARLANGTKGLPPSHPLRYPQDETYPKLLGPLGAKPTVWATCLFVDPMADIAVLGRPDELPDQAEAYEELLGSLPALVVADAPAQGSELHQLNHEPAGKWAALSQSVLQTPGEGPARVLSLQGRWLKGRVKRQGGWLSFEPGKFFKSGMSGSPVIDQAGAAIGVVSASASASPGHSPVIVDRLSAQLVRAIAAPRGSAPLRREE
jgi:hypothetical protein